MNWDRKVTMTEKLNEIKNNLVLELHVPDFEPGRQFYSAFGFEELTYDPTSGGGSDMGYLVLIRHDSIGDTLLNFYGDKDSVAQHAHFSDFPPSTPRGYGVEITIPVSDIAALWEKVDGMQGGTVSQPLTLKRWGKQDFRVVDPYGFYVRFTELVDWGQKQ
ncbi:MAG TPA: hypothetical protein VHD60_04120 [Candidatus Saccharimonadales bacterium]|nr:hypothetical protein [Candidatus Saccharimonadales bacterium]